ncbi:hypothetical protein L3Q82_022961 [Scortum barcoo]|uniref:Uncharacterized protein n=1 Tax=Scortum barcoo TaxID=214431 RepID=A0ACB8WXV7_9TELE|nr:hypothetical protein L3Q82_022961 [Scortum barcoo]
MGDGERAVKDQPVEVKLPQELNVEGSDADVDVADVVGVACGSRHSFIWTETGQAYSFGNNFYAQLGYDFQRADFKEHQLAPRLFQNLPSSLKISQVACGERHTLFALEDGSVAACGTAVKMVYPAAWEVFETPSPTFSSPSVSLPALIVFTLEMQNDYGQIGCGSNENAVVPRFLECMGRVSKVTCGANHNLALTGTVQYEM